jgi:hypothetical protein
MLCAECAALQKERGDLAGGQRLMVLPKRQRPKFTISHSLCGKRREPAFGHQL